MAPDHFQQLLAAMFGALVSGILIGCLLTKMFIKIDNEEKEKKKAKEAVKAQAVRDADLGLKIETCFTHPCRCQVPVTSTYVRICRQCNHHCPEQICMFVWVLIPIALFCLVVGSCFPLCEVLCCMLSGRSVDERDVEIGQMVFLWVFSGLGGPIGLIMYLWNLPSVAKDMSKKFARHRERENRKVLTVAETYLEVYLGAIKTEADRRARTLVNDQPFDNIGLQQWFQLVLYSTPLVPCVIGGLWVLIPFLGILLLDTISGCKALRFCFQLCLGTHSVLKFDQKSLKVSLADPSLASFPVPPTGPCVPATISHDEKTGCVSSDGKWCKTHQEYYNTFPVETKEEKFISVAS
jgi:hypothetical protein